MESSPPLDQDVLFRALYEELHRVAVRMMRRLKPGHTLQPSALVHEALLRLMTSGVISRGADKQELYGTAVQAMRSVLIDHYRHRNAIKRGGGWVRHPLDDVLDHFESAKSSSSSTCTTASTNWRRWSRGRHLG